MSASQEKRGKEEKKDASAPVLPLALTDDIGKKDTLDAVIAHYNAWLPKYQELAQGRSNFQIEKMIATEHITPVASYQHTLYQLRVMHQALMDDFVRGIEKTREFEYKWKDKPHDVPQWWDLERGGKKLCWYDTDKLTLDHEIEELKMSVKDKLLQLQTFTKVLQAMEEKHGGTFTQADLNAEEPEYWKMRFAQQMTDSYLDRQTGLGTGNIKSLRMGLADSPVAGSKNRIEDFPDIFNAALGGREEALQVLNEVNETLFKGMNTLGAGGETSSLETAAAPTPTAVPERGADQDPALDKLRSVGIGVSELED